MSDYKQDPQTKPFIAHSADNRFSTTLFSSFHMIGSLIGSFIAILLGSVGILMLNSSQGGELLLLSGGSVFVAAGFALLYWLARTRGEFTLERALLLNASCALGGLGLLLTLVSGYPLLMLIGMLMGFSASVGVWCAVWNVAFLRPKALTGSLA
jgi:hypothetical protein